MTCLIETLDLVKKYRVGQEVITALDSVNMRIDPGEFICVLGASGSGKSTLLHTVAGLDKPTRGDIVVRGTSIVKMKERDMALFRRRYMGFIFQAYNLIPTLTALENVSMPLMFDGVGRRERYKRARDILTQMGLKDRLKNKPTEMSGGQQQRVSIARALINDPKILYADEPTGNLDTKTTKEIMEILRERVRQGGVTLMMVTHNLELAEYADRVIHMVDGRIIKIDSKHKGELAE
ncbi:MAG: ABC transporter ATP-binding protein [Peptococcaceae bacterium]|jgi:putative ABC transport system ATP-binding protein|nr:ABC transporter ATP-binding protein [Peptococcaceae bacterium]